MAVKTIPKLKGRRMDRKTPPPMYQDLVRDMGFDPCRAVDTMFEDWALDETYPPTVGELLLSVQTEETHGEQEESGGQGSSEALGGGDTVPGGPEDGGPVGIVGPGGFTEDPGRTQALPQA